MYRSRQSVSVPLQRGIHIIVKLPLFAGSRRRVSTHDSDSVVVKVGSLLMNRFWAADVESLCGLWAANVFDELLCWCQNLLVNPMRSSINRTSWPAAAAVTMVSMFTSRRSRGKWFIEIRFPIPLVVFLGTLSGFRVERKTLCSCPCTTARMDSAELFFNLLPCLFARRSISVMVAMRDTFPSLLG